MSTFRQIRIIKRDERHESQPGQTGESTALAFDQQTERDAGAIIASWVSELRQKKAQEARAFNSLFQKVA